MPDAAHGFPERVRALLDDLDASGEAAIGAAAAARTRGRGCWPPSTTWRRRAARGPPRWTSANVPGGDEVNAALLERYRHRVPELTGE